MGSRNLSEPPLLDGISLIATVLLLHNTILSQLRFSSLCSLLEPPLTITYMVHIIAQRLANLRAVHILAHGPQRCLGLDFTTLRRKRHICTAQLEGTGDATVLGF